MDGSKFGSIRSINRPSIRRPSFRDDKNIVAVRYEKTKQGEAPTQVTSLSFPRVRSRPPSSSGASAISHRRGPVIVIPPPQLVEPPAGQHPALRHTSTEPRALACNEWKRDSGHAQAGSVSSTPTINEEACEDEGACQFSPRNQWHLSQNGVPSHAVQPSGDAGLNEQTGKQVLLSAHQQGATNQMSSSGAVDVAAPYSPTLLYPGSPRTSITMESRDALHSVAHPSAKSSSPRTLAKTFSFRAVSSMMRRESLDEVLLVGEPPASAPLERGYSRPLFSPDNHATTRKEQASQTAKSPSAVATFWSKAPFTSRFHSTSSTPTPSDASFAPLSVSIPTHSLLDDDFISGLSFSKRGSVMLDGQRALSFDETRTMDFSQSSDEHNGPKPAAIAAKAEVKPSRTLAPPAEASTPTTTSVAPSDLESHETAATGETTPEIAPPQAQEPPQAEALDQQEPSREQTQTQQPPLRPSLSQRQLTDASSLLAPPPNIHVMAADVDRDSQKVRSLYAVGGAIRWEDGAEESLGERQDPPMTYVAEGNEQNPSRIRAGPAANRSASGGSSARCDNVKKEVRIAGGLEDHDNLDGAIIDRYGFITIPRPVSSRSGAPTELKSAQFSPRRRNVLQKRDLSGLSSPSAWRPLTPSRKTSARSLHTTHSARSGTSLRSSRSVIRQASNLLPHNRERKWADEAGEMLTVAPNLQDIAEEVQVERISEALKRKEWERSEKWRKMAKNIKKENQGEGMEFEFDTKNTKLIERTWKGIPDRWRAAAWWAFMASAAKARPGSATEGEIIADFHRLQTVSSPDDVQIDLDVPRTISRHIMFRKRYSGGQRLLFRVLHALSIYYPVTGYVQGMASLGATLLCYFDEEKCFVMLVRMWRFRGLDRLYRPGFEGLMTALKEFETSYLNKDVAKNLTEQDIDATAYGTRWYLTLFNLSLPFPAQLRVWDVFLLLGGDGEKPETKAQAKKPSTPVQGADPKPPPTGLDVLHATSAAIIQALKEVLLDSDFENAMKALTSAIPIKDEDILMKVTKAEWKAHAGKKKA